MKKNFAKKLRIVCFFLVVVVVFIGCVSFTPSNISYEDDVHEDGMGYIYGRFRTLPMLEGGISMLFHAPVSEYLEDYYFGYPTFSLVVDKNAFFFGLDDYTEVQMMPVKAGTYSIDAIEYLSYEEGQESFPFEVSNYNNEIVVKPNTAVYIGDFSGTLGRNYDNDLVWDFHGPVSNFEKTTADLKEKYSLLSDSNISFSSIMN